MKNLAVAVLILFAASLVGGALAAGCMAPPRVAVTEVQLVQSETPSCCAVQAACMGGSCFAGARDVGCSAHHGSIAVTQHSSSDLAKAPVLAIVPAPSLIAIAIGHVPRPRLRVGDHTSVSGYADIYARTGRLLI